LTGALYIDPTHALYVGAAIASSRHRHHAGQVLWAPAGLVIEDEAGCRREVTAHFVPPNRPHGHGAAAAVAMLWVDRDDLDWDRALRHAHNAPDELRTSIGSRIEQSLTKEEARSVARALLDWIAPAGAAEFSQPLHPAVTRMCALLDSTAPDRDVRMTRLAQQAGLSLRQLRHRFSEELGMNPSAYLRWRRLRQAVNAIERGASLTEAALEAGFADSAHFSRVFLAHFGMAPSQALSSIRFRGPTHEDSS
jgi:AraC-like DNA-binding protein